MKCYLDLFGIYFDILSGSCGPAMPTAIKSRQLRSGRAHCDRELSRREEDEDENEEEEETPLIKSDNPHLAAEEKHS